MKMIMRHSSALAAFAIAMVMLATSAQAVVTSNARVRRIKTYDGGTIHITFDRGVCGSQTWAKISPTERGRDTMLRVAIAAKLSGNLVNVDVVDGGGGGAACALDYIQLDD